MIVSVTKQQPHKLNNVIQRGNPIYNMGLGLITDVKSNVDMSCLNE